jgi:hypothetical protein
VFVSSNRKALVQAITGAFYFVLDNNPFLFFQAHLAAWERLLKPFINQAFQANLSLTFFIWILLSQGQNLTDAPVNQPLLAC